MLIANVILAVCAACAPSAVATNAPLRVAVYMGRGSQGSGAFRHLQLATIARGVEGFPVDEQTIRDGALDRADVLVMTGGSATEEGTALGEVGRERIRRFIRGGGGYIGTCAGCYLLQQSEKAPQPMPGRLGLIPFVREKELGSGQADMNLRFTGAAAAFGIRSNSVHRIRYSGGPVLLPGSPVEDSSYEVLATYDSDIAPKKRASMAGKAAMVAGRCGRGRVFVSAVHPEVDLDDHCILKAAIRYVSGRRDIDWTMPSRRPGQLSVGLLCGPSTGHKTALDLQKIIRSGAFDLEPLTNDDIQEGEYAHFDALLATDTVVTKGDAVGLGKKLAAFTKAFLARGGRIVAWGVHGKDYAALGKGVTVVGDADEAVSALAALATAPSPETPEWGRKKVERPVRVAFYADRGGITCEILEALELSSEYAVTVVTGEAIRKGALKDADLLFMPGGGCHGEYLTLGDEGVDEIRRFVRAGGKYYGVCAGAFLASQQKSAEMPRMGLVPWKTDAAGGYRGWANVDLKLTKEGLGVFSGSAANRSVLYWGGPVLVPGEPVEDSDIGVFATYAWDVVSTCSPKARTSMRDKAAIVGGRVGKGRVYVQCPHPECSARNFDMVLSGFEFLTGVRPTRLERHKVRGQPVVGYESFRDAEFAEFFRKLVRDRRVYSRNMHDRWTENDMQHIDVLLALRPSKDYFARSDVKSFLASGRPVVALVRTPEERTAVEGLKNANVLTATSYDGIFPLLLSAAPSRTPAHYGFTITADRANCRYAPGEEATFTVKCRLGKDGGAGGEVEVWLDDFGTGVQLKRKVDPAKENPIVVRGKLDRPGFLRVVARNLGVEPTLFGEGKGSAVYSVGYAPERIVQAVPRPADFVSYWRGEQARLEREVPLDPKVEKVGARSKGAFNFYLISFATFHGKRVYGALTEPKAPGKYPFLLTVPGAGPSWAIDAMPAESGMIRAVINIHPEPVPANRKAAMKSYPGGEYPIDGILASREDAFYHDIWLGIDRAVTYLVKRDNVDRSRVLYSGGSQGGGSGLALMALNGAFTRGVVREPALTDVNGCEVGRISGWPRFLERTGMADAARKNAPYFDGVNFASMITIPVRVSAGLADTTCPPTAVYSAYNALASKDKAIFESPGVGHTTPRQTAKRVDKWLRSGK